jgi:hypothetical protein
VDWPHGERIVDWPTSPASSRGSGGGARSHRSNHSVDEFAELLQAPRRGGGVEKLRPRTPESARSGVSADQFDGDTAWQSAM